jgi:hypothetical protein
MPVNADHEGTFSGDGEYDVAVYVQGIKIQLSDKSGPGSGLSSICCNRKSRYKVHSR